jgi:hypothetical protein
MMDKARYTEIGRRMRDIPLEHLGSSYEWEELVQRLCTSDDAGLHDIGLRERDELSHKHLLNVMKK